MRRRFLTIRSSKVPKFWLLLDHRFLSLTSVYQRSPTGENESFLILPHPLPPHSPCIVVTTEKLDPHSRLASIVASWGGCCLKESIRNYLFSACHVLLEMTFNDLPLELLPTIISFTRLGTGESEEALATCCLVCKGWLAIAHPMLFRDITVQYVGNLLRLSKSLKRSRVLASWVHSLRVEVSSDEIDAFSGGVALDRTLAKCLEKTRELEVLELAEESSSIFTNTVIKRICLLPKLRELTIDQARPVVEDEDEENEENPHAVNQHVENQHAFDPRLLLRLPSTIVKLDLSFPSAELCKLLPSICANLHRTPTGITPLSELPDSDLVVGRQLDLPTGLKALTLTLEHDKNLSATIPSLSRVLSSTLTSFTFYAGPEINKTMWIDFYSAAQELRDLELSCITASTRCLFGYLRLSQLEHISISLWVCTGMTWHNFCRSFRNFIKRSSSRLNSFEVGLVLDDDDISPDELIESLVSLTTRGGSNSALRKLILTNFSSVSINVFENLCLSAKKLENLAIKVPLEHKARVVSALEKLKQLVHVELNGISLTNTSDGLQPFWNQEPACSESGELSDVYDDDS